MCKRNHVQATYTTPETTTYISIAYTVQRKAIPFLAFAALWSADWQLEQTGEWKAGLAIQCSAHHSVKDGLRRVCTFETSDRLLVVGLGWNVSGGTRTARHCLQSLGSLRLTDGAWRRYLHQLTQCRKWILLLYFFVVTSRLSSVIVGDDVMNISYISFLLQYRRRLSSLSYLSSFIYIWCFYIKYMFRVYVFDIFSMPFQFM